MKPQQAASRRFLLVPALALSGVLTLGALAERSEAALTIKVENSSASASGTGAFDVLLINDAAGPAYDVSAFSVRLSVLAASGVTFTNATAATVSATYIFDGIAHDFLFDPVSPTEFKGSDGVLDPPFVVALDADQTVGLLHVEYAVAAGAAPGVVQVSIVDTSNTQINDAIGDPIDFTPMEGQITINGGGVVPEPASLITLATAAVLLPIPPLVRRMRRKNG